MSSLAPEMARLHLNCPTCEGAHCAARRGGPNACNALMGALQRPDTGAAILDLLGGEARRAPALAALATTCRAAREFCQRGARRLLNPKGGERRRGSPRPISPRELAAVFARPWEGLDSIHLDFTVARHGFDPADGDAIFTAMATRAHPRLCQLLCAGLRVTPAAAVALGTLDAPLEELELERCEVGADGNAVLAALAAGGRAWPLRAMSLDMRFGDAGAAALALAPWPLVKLDVHGSGGDLTASGVEALAHARWRLEALWFTGVHMTPEAMRALATAWAPTLRSVEVGVAGDECLEALTVAEWPTLEQLHVESADVTLRGAAALSRAQMPRLRAVRLYGARIGPALEALAAAPWGVQTKFMTDEGLVVFEGPRVREAALP
jgi:hypothetical protein